jgi:stress response protein SCP2
MFNLLTRSRRASTKVMQSAASQSVITVGLDWEVFGCAQDINPDIAAFVLDEAGSLITVMSGVLAVDTKRRIVFDLSSLPEGSDCVTIFVGGIEHLPRRGDEDGIDWLVVSYMPQTFESWARVSLAFGDAGLVAFELQDCKEGISTFAFGELRRYDGEWRFQSVAQELSHDFNQVARDYSQ